MLAAVACAKSRDSGQSARDDTLPMGGLSPTSARDRPHNFSNYA